MNLLMTATPLAMGHEQHAFSSTALVIEWHVIGMFAPGFVTGNLIARFGVLRMMLVGAALNFVCVAIALSGPQEKIDDPGDQRRARVRDDGHLVVRVGHVAPCGRLDYA